ncbi:MAG: two-component system chemotaxis response regulator CheB [Polaribacter sp.]
MIAANNDGAKRLKAVKAAGGISVVEDPVAAEVKIMPQAVLDWVKPDYVLPLEKIGQLLVVLANH